MPLGDLSRTLFDSLYTLGMDVWTSLQPLASTAETLPKCNCLNTAPYWDPSQMS